MPKKLNNSNDQWAIAYLDQLGNEHWLETHSTQGAAKIYCQIVNDHEIDNDREPKFYVAPTISLI